MQILIVALLLAGILLIQALMGGFSLLFALPGYSLIAVAAILVLFRSHRRLNAGASIVGLASALALAGYVVWRSRTSPVEYLAWPDFFMVLAALAVYWITACYLKMARHRLWVAYGLFAIALLHTAAGILQFVYGQQFMLLSLLPDGPWLPKIFRPNYGWRASGFYGCPNHLAGLLETLGLLALSCCLLGRRKIVGRTLFAYFLLTCFLGIAITGSRGGYLSTAGGLVTFAVIVLWILRKLRPGRFWISAISSLVLLGLMVGGALLVMRNSSALERRLTSIGDSQDVRLKMWPAALKQFHLNPITGTGSGTYLYYGRQFRSAVVQRDPMHVHNDYLELLGEYGVVGASLLGLFLVVHLVLGWRGLTRIVRLRLGPAGRVCSDELALVAGSLAAVAALVVHSVVDFNFHIPGNTLFFAFLFGILASPTSDPKITADKPSPILWPTRLLLPALGAFILFLAIPLLPSEYHAEWARVQLRNLVFVDKLFEAGASMNLAASSVPSGVPSPGCYIRRDWPDDFNCTHLLALAGQHADAGLLTEKRNPNLYYYAGEVRRNQAVYLSNNPDPASPPRETPAIRQRRLLAEAGDFYVLGLRLFPQDVRLQFKLAQIYDGLGVIDRIFYEKAEAVYMSALQADPNLAEIYARYGVHLFRRHKLLRAKLYYQKAMSFPGGNELAEAGLDDLAVLQAHSQDPKFVEQFGNPLNDMDMEPPTEEDEKRCGTLHE